MSVFYNIRAQFIEDENYLINLIRLHQPKWALVMDGLGLAIKLRQASPNTNIIHRTWPDGDNGLKDVGSPSDFIKRKTEELKGTDGIWAYTVNEIGLQQDWHIELIQRLAALNWPFNVVICNPSVGTPSNVDEWKSDKTLQLLRLADQYREHVVIGMHEYAQGLITSGLQDKHYETNPTLWPSVIDPKKNNWHCGRFKWLVDVCIANRILAPRIVITEFGFGNSDGNIQELPTGAWHTLDTYWYNLWHKDAQTAYSDQIIYADNVIYKYGNCVEAELIFQYGGKESGLWNAFDVEKAHSLHATLVEHEHSMVSPTTTITTKNVTLEAKDINTPVRFRANPVLSTDNIIGYIKDKVLAIQYVSEPTVAVDGYTMAKFSINNTDGYAALELLKISDPVPSTEISVDIIKVKDIKTRLASVKVGLAELTKEVDDLDRAIQVLDK